MSRIDSNLFSSGGLASRLNGRKLPSANEWQFSKSQTSPQIETNNKTIASKANDSKRAYNEAPENFTIPKISPNPPMRLLKPTKIDIKI